MQTKYLGFGLILLALFFFLKMYSQALPQRTNRCHHSVYTDHVKTAKQEPSKDIEEHDINMHDETKRVMNKGFVNELMYKPSEKNEGIEYQSKLVEDEYKTMSLHHKRTSKDLPIANIDVRYLLANDTTMLVY